MSRRSKSWEALVEAVTAQRWGSCRELLYRVLYGLVAGQQLALAKHIMTRYLPHFQGRWPDVAWAQKILQDTDAWIQQFRRRVPEDPPRENPGDAHFLFAFDALLLGTFYSSDASVVTSSSARAILEAIDASAEDRVSLNSLDPEAYMKGERVANSARTQEWQEVIAWLQAREVHLAPDAPPDQLERDLQTWKEHAMLLIVPDSAPLWT